MEDIVAAARNIIAANRYLALATCTGEDPWVAPLAYAVDKDYTFYYYSASNSRHSQHIKHNRQVAFTIYDSSLPSDKVDGLQVAAIASEIAVTELPHVIEMYYRQVFTDELIRAAWRQPLEAFKGIALKRFYKLEPKKVFKLNLAETGVDVRVEVPLEQLRTLPAR